MRAKYIDVLKAFAIFAVILYHAGFMSHGYLGVDLFLVISGYLTTKSLYSKVFDKELRGVQSKRTLESPMVRYMQSTTTKTILRHTLRSKIKNGLLNVITFSLLYMANAIST